jgi:hypothetical protein
LRSRVDEDRVAAADSSFSEKPLPCEPSFLIDKIRLRFQISTCRSQMQR